MRELPPPQDQDWLEALFTLHARRVRAYAIRRVGPDAADDVVSEVFGVAWRRRHTVPEPALPWLLRTAHHVVSHERRALARRLNLRDAVAGVLADTSTPGADVSGRALAESVLGQLSSTDAEILRLTAWEGLTPAEIAVVLDLSDSATRTRLKRARPARPAIRESDIDIDYPAVMGSRERLWEKYGEAWGWPPATMTREEDQADLARHEAEIAAKETFNYAVLPEGEDRLLGCVYLDPPEDDCPPGTDVLTSWWVVDDEAGGELEKALDEFVPRWLRDVWGFRQPHVDP